MVKKNESNIVKYKCNKCKYIKCYTKKEILTAHIKKTIFNVFVLFGILFLGAFIFIGPQTMLSTYTSSALTFSSKVDTNYLREISIDVTSNCQTNNLESNAYCHGYTIFKNLSNIRYVPASFYKLLEDETDTYLQGGDCKHMSMLYVSMMRSLGFDAYIHCNQNKNHCVAILPNVHNYERLNGYIVVDLTVPGFYEMSSGTSPWDYLEEGIRYD